MIRRACCLCLLIFAAATIASAQCPKLKLATPADVEENTPITFYVEVTGGPKNAEATYNWTVSAGTISSGQGTPAITVDTTGVGSTNITATVNVGGYDRQCRTEASATASVMAKQKPRKIDEYGALKTADRNARLDNYAIELQNDPTAQGYVIVYAGRRSVPGAAKSVMNMSKTYLVATRGIFGDRILTVDGGYREELTTELWIVPSGGTPPQAEPTVDPSEIKAPIKKKPAPKRTRH